MSYIEKIELAKRMNYVADLLNIPEKGKNRQKLFGEKFGVSQEAARKWLSGEAIPTDERCILISKEAGVSYEWLKTGRGNIKDVDLSKSSSKVSENLSSYNADNANEQILFSRATEGKNQNECPVISWVQAGGMCSPDYGLSFNDAEEWRYCPVKHSDKTFVLTIAGTSMQPEYMEGSEIFVDPTIEPLHNDDVVVCDEEGRATFKRLKISPEGKYLEALNPDFPQRIIAVPKGTIICGVVIYSGRKTR